MAVSSTATVAHVRPIPAALPPFATSRRGRRSQMVRFELSGITSRTPDPTLHEHPRSALGRSPLHQAVDFVRLSSDRPRPPTIVVRNWFGRASGPAPDGQNALQIFGLRAPATRCDLYC